MIKKNNMFKAVSVIGFFVFFISSSIHAEVPIISYSGEGTSLAGSEDAVEYEERSTLSERVAVEVPAQRVIQEKVDDSAEATLLRQRIDVLEQRVSALERKLLAASTPAPTPAPLPVTPAPSAPTIYGAGGVGGGTASGLKVEDMGNKTIDHKSTGPASATTAPPAQNSEFNKTVESIRAQEKEKAQYLDKLMEEQ